MIVMKFGGSSVKNAERISNVASIVKSRLSQKPIIVVSALGGITDLLIDTANAAREGKEFRKNLKEIAERHHSTLNDLKLDVSMVDALLQEYSAIVEEIGKIKEITPALMDQIQSFGERMSARIVAAAFNKLGIKAEAYDAYDIGLITNDDHGNAEPLEEAYPLIKKRLEGKRSVPIITGFIAKNKAGTITTLGRGGSDYTAAIIGAAVDADEIQIWTDVNGVMTTDPRIVPHARTIPEISFNEASELAFFGAKVLHPKTILPAVEKNIPVKVLNTYEPDNKGTTVVKEATQTKGAVKAIACKKDIILVTVNSLRMLEAHGFLAKLFEVFAKYRKSVDMISTSEVSVSLTVNQEKDLDKIIKECSKFADVKVSNGKALICLVGEGMKHTAGIAGKIFSTIGKNGISIEMISQGASEINISFIVSEAQREKVINILHDEFFGK
ncbi:MAG TPA: lysine-sensitive aspartokinase 3 [Candidatus Nanoarchaeia archaeon]|nr:lysine-sensitive aspartokinase 3 [Candidatus Nanoarchaeia archaeon]